LKKVNLGLIGLGGIGQIHLNNSIRLKDANLLGIADVSKRARARAIEDHARTK